MNRRRFLALGIAIFALVAGLAGSTSAEVSSGDRSVFVPIVPCRLFDTRAEAPVGPRITPLGPNGVMTQAVHGTNGNCTIPADATAIALNVTTLNSTSASYLTLWPADAARPLASNLNWSAGAPPTPNKVDVKVSVDGKVSLYNLAGSVDVLADAVGYYVGHNHDDRYYTKVQVDSSLATKVTKPVGQSYLTIGAASFNATNPSQANGAYFQPSGSWSSLSAGFGACLVAPVVLPAGVVITQIDMAANDSTSADYVDANLYRDPVGDGVTTRLATAQTGFASTPGSITASETVPDELVDPNVNAYFLYVCGIRSSTALYDVTIIYNNPA